MTQATSSKGLGWLIGAGVLVGFCAASLWIWIPRAAVVPSASTTPTVDLAARVQAMDEKLAGFIEVTSERPLFHATRRPEPTATPEAPPAPPPEPTLALVGILGEGDARIALVRTSTSPQLYRLETNATLGPWEVLEITDRSVRVLKDGNEQTLRIGE